MAGIRLSGQRGLVEELLNPGDTALLGESVAYNAIVGSTVITAQQLLAGIVLRSGSVGAYGDTLDTAANIIAGMAGNNPAGPVVIGHTFRSRIISSVAYADTLVLGSGMISGTNYNAVVAASSWRDYLFTMMNVQPILQLPGNTTNGSTAVGFTLPTGMVALPIGVSLQAANIMPGASVTGTGIPAGTTVAGIVLGQGGIIGITLSAAATATGVNVALSFGPVVKVETIGAGTV